MNQPQNSSPMPPAHPPQAAAKTRRWLERAHAKPPEPKLRFTPTAWAKLIFLRDLGDTEVGGFGVTVADDLLLVEDFCLVRQTCSPVTVAFDDEAVADFFDRQVDLGRRPAQFGRLWIHTHPGSSLTPSSTDEATFARVFGRSDWALMFILASEGATYARLRFNAGPGGSLSLSTHVDYGQPFPAADHEAWLAEYEACVCEETMFLPVLGEMLPMGWTDRADLLATERPWLEAWDEPLD